MSSNQIEWMDIARIATASSLLVFILGFLKDHIKEKVNEKKKSRTIAAKVAVKFDEYVLDCSNILLKYNLHNDSGGCLGDNSIFVPKFRKLDFEVDFWRVDPDLLSRVLGFEVEILYKIQSINHYSETDNSIDGDNSKEYVAMAVGDLGWQACVISKDLRRLYQLPNTLSAEWDIPKFLRPYSDNWKSLNRR